MSPDDPRHGTANGYNNLHCRCERCREAIRAYYSSPEQRRRINEWRWRTGRHQPRNEYLASIRPDHGTESRYSAGCRCPQCKAASAEARQRRRLADIEHTRAYDRERRRRERAA